MKSQRLAVTLHLSLSSGAGVFISRIGLNPIRFLGEFSFPWQNRSEASEESKEKPRFNILGLLLGSPGRSG